MPQFCRVGGALGNVCVIDRVHLSDSHKKFSLVFFDMDQFKTAVDTHGHLIGANVLRKVDQVIGHQLRKADRIVRYGGDEFFAILPGQDRAQALAKTERMRRAIGDTVFFQEGEICICLTASFGVATFPDDAGDEKHLLMEADQCLFQSKKDGEDRVTA